MRELGATTVRYPGGNFVSTYRWEDGVGPVADRPARLDPAWHTLETNAFGVNEFMRWVRKAGLEPIMAINLGTRGIEAALDLLEYTNHRGGTRLSDQRRANGAQEPYGIRMWCLGNEMDGPWQIGHKTATEYGRLAAADRQRDAPHRSQPPADRLWLVPLADADVRQWEREVLTETYDQVDMISLHAYYQRARRRHAELPRLREDMDHFIDSVVAIADSVRANETPTSAS